MSSSEDEHHTESHSKDNEDISRPSISKIGDTCPLGLTADPNPVAVSSQDSKVNEKHHSPCRRSTVSPKKEKCVEPTDLSHSTNRHGADDDTLNTPEKLIKTESVHEPSTSRLLPEANIPGSSIPRPSMSKSLQPYEVHNFSKSEDFRLQLGPEIEETLRSGKIRLPPLTECGTSPSKMIMIETRHKVPESNQASSTRESEKREGESAPVPRKRLNAPVRRMRGRRSVHGTQGRRAVHGTQGRRPVRGIRRRQPIRGILGSAPARGMRGSAPVRGMRGSAPVRGMRGSAPVRGMRGSAPAHGMRGNAPVRGIRGRVPARGMRGSVPARGMRGSAPVRGMRGSAPVRGMRGSVPARGMRGSAPARGLPGSTPVRGKSKISRVKKNVRIVEMNVGTGCTRARGRRCSPPQNRSGCSLESRRRESSPVNLQFDDVLYLSQTSSTLARRYHPRIALNARSYGSTLNEQNYDASMSSHTRSASMNRLNDTMLMDSQYLRDLNRYHDRVIEELYFFIELLERYSISAEIERIQRRSEGTQTQMRSVGVQTETTSVSASNQTRDTCIQVQPRPTTGQAFDVSINRFHHMQPRNRLHCLSPTSSVRGAPHTCSAASENNQSRSCWACGESYMIGSMHSQKSPTSGQSACLSINRPSCSTSTSELHHDDPMLSTYDYRPLASAWHGDSLANDYVPSTSVREELHNTNREQDLHQAEHGETSYSVQPQEPSSDKRESADAEVPDLELPVVDESVVDLPDLEFPALEVPVGELPVVQLPTVQLPFVELPDLELPDEESPNLELSDEESSDVESSDEEMPDLILPDLILPDLILPDLILPNDELPDLILPNDELPDLESSDEEIPNLVLVDEESSNEEMPDLILPDEELPVVELLVEESPDERSSSVESTTGR